MEERDLLPWTQQQWCAEEAHFCIISIKFILKGDRKHEWEEKPEEQSFLSAVAGKGSGP